MGGTPLKGGGSWGIHPALGGILQRGFLVAELAKAVGLAPSPASPEGNQQLSYDHLDGASLSSLDSGTVPMCIGMR